MTTSPCGRHCRWRWTWGWAHSTRWCHPSWAPCRHACIAHAHHSLLGPGGILQQPCTPASARTHGQRSQSLPPTSCMRRAAACRQLNQQQLSRTFWLPYQQLWLPTGSIRRSAKRGAPLHGPPGFVEPHSCAAIAYKPSDKPHLLMLSPTPSIHAGCPAAGQPQPSSF